MIIVQNAEIKKIVIHSKAADFEEMWISVRFLRTAASLFYKIRLESPGIFRFQLIWTVFSPRSCMVISTKTEKVLVNKYVGIASQHY